MTGSVITSVKWKSYFISVKEINEQKHWKLTAKREKLQVSIHTLSIRFLVALPRQHISFFDLSQVCMCMFLLNSLPELKNNSANNILYLTVCYTLLRVIKTYSRTTNDKTYLNCYPIFWSITSVSYLKKLLTEIRRRYISITNMSNIHAHNKGNVFKIIQMHTQQLYFQETK